MTQSNVDTDFVEGLQLIIDSLMKESDYDDSTEVEKALPALAAIPAAVGVGLGTAARAVPAALGMAARVVGSGAGQAVGEVGRAVGGVASGIGEAVGDSGRGDTDVATLAPIESADDNDLPEADHWCPDVMDWHTSDHKPAKAPSVHINVDQDNGDDPYQSENSDIEKAGALGSIARAAAPVVGAAIGEKIANRIKKGEYDQNTNLPPEFGKREEGDSIAEPFLRKRESLDEDIEKQEGMGAAPPMSSAPPPSMGSSMTMSKEYDQSLDILKIWASVDRTLPKDDDLTLIDDLSILKSFRLDASINIEYLVEGTLVHKMLVDRASRPTKEWWEAGIALAEGIESIEEPAICTAFLYYEPDTFDIRDFQKDIPGVGGGETQDIQNVGSASAIDGLGMSADGHTPEDKDCDT